MRRFFENPWWVALLTAVIVAAAVFGGAKTLIFQPRLLSEVVPALLGSLFAVALFTERAVAVLNDIWFGEEREKKEEAVRLTGQALGAARAARQARQGIVLEAIRVGGTPAAAAVTEISIAVDAKTEALAVDLQAANAALATTEAQVDRARLALSFTVALVVSALGVRALEAMFKVSGLHADQMGVFHAVDIVLTAGVLAGGTSGISAIADLLGSYVNASRKRALENR